VLAFAAGGIIDQAFAWQAIGGEAVGAIDLGSAHSDSKWSMNMFGKDGRLLRYFQAVFFAYDKKYKYKKARQCKGGTGRQKGYIRVSKTTKATDG
jgi:hypothetical protein